MESGSGKGMDVGSFLLHHKRWMELSKLHDKHKDLLESIAYLEKMDRGPREHKSLEELWREEQELRKKQKELLNSLGLEYHEGAESESGKGTEIDYGKEPEKERDYGKEPEKERDSGKEPEKERDYGKEPEKERDSGKEPGKERESGKEPDMEMAEMKDRRKLNKKQRKLLKQKQKKLMKKRLKERDSGDLLGSFAPTFSGKHQSLVKEIISMERERRDLLGSLTPTFSLWKEIDSQRTWTIARNEKPANSSSRDNDDENQLVDYFNLTLQDMEDLGHRMLSMLYFLNKSNERIFSHKATELCNTAAELNTHISKEFSTNHEQEQETEREEEPWQINLSSLFRKFSRSPDNYNNTLAKSVIEEDEMRKYKGFKVEDEYQDEDESTMEFLKKRMEVEQQFFANHRTYWEDVWGSRIGRCGGFMDTTILSSMQFTHYTPGSIPSPAAVAGSTLQIYSIKIKNLKGLNWPLRVYGEVAARDTVDYNRNILFSRSEFNYQELNGEDDSLCLTGPSRAIVALRHVDFEVELQVTDGAQSQTLISRRKRYGCTDAFFSSLANVTDGGDGRTFLISNQSCTAEVTLDQLARSLQATIVGVRVTEGGWPFKHGCRVVCSWFPAAQISSSDTSCRRVVLLDHRGSGMRRGSDKYLHLSRKVVSVESYGTLRVKIEAYGKSHRYIARMCQIDFPVRKCQTERFKCPVGHGGPTVEVTVAWSLLVEEKVHLSLVDCPAI